MYKFYHSFSNKAKKHFGLGTEDAIVVAYHSRFHTKHEQKFYSLTGVRRRGPGRRQGVKGRAIPCWGEGVNFCERGFFLCLWRYGDKLFFPADQEGPAGSDPAGSHQMHESLYPIITSGLSCNCVDAYNENENLAPT